MNNQTRIVALGDSLTYGFPYLPSSSWVQLVADETGLKVINKGANGNTTAGMLVRFNRDVLQNKPSHVIIMGGANDAFENIAVAEVNNNIQQMAELALHEGVIPIIGLTPPCNFASEEALLGQYRQVLRDYAVRMEFTILDFYTAMANSNGFIKNGLHVDGVHPNKAGYRVMADAAAEILGLINGD